MAHKRSLCRREEEDKFDKFEAKVGIDFGLSFTCDAERTNGCM